MSSQFRLQEFSFNLMYATLKSILQPSLKIQIKNFIRANKVSIPKSISTMSGFYNLLIITSSPKIIDLNKFLSVNCYIGNALSFESNLFKVVI